MNVERINGICLGEDPFCSNELNEESVKIVNEAREERERAAEQEKLHRRMQRQETAEQAVRKAKRKRAAKLRNRRKATQIALAVVAMLLTEILFILIVKMIGG